MDWVASVGLNNRNLFFIALESQKFEIKVPGDSVPWEGSPFDFQSEAFDVLT